MYDFENDMNSNNNSDIVFQHNVADCEKIVLHYDMINSLVMSTQNKYFEI